MEIFYISAEGLKDSINFNLNAIYPLKLLPQVTFSPINPMTQLCPSV